MKKVFVAMILTVVYACCLWGCASSGSSKIDSPNLQSEFANAPKWVTKGGSDE